MIANGTETIDQLTREIHALDSSQVQGELKPFLEGSFLESMIAAEGIGATLGVMGAVGDAIGRVGEPETEAAFANNAAGSLADLMRDEEFEPASFEETKALIAQAGQYAEAIKDDPAAQASRKSDIAEGIVRLSANYSSNDEILELGTTAFAFIDGAAESAEKIKDSPVSQTSAFKRAAEVSATLVASLSEAEMDGYLQLMPRFSQPAEMYEKAYKAGSTIEGSEKRHDRQGDIVRSMAKSAVQIEATSPEQSKQLTSLVLEKVDEELEGYKPGGEEAEVLAITKALNLIRLGSQLSTVIDKEYGSPERQDSPVRRQLIDRMVTVFKATLAYRQEASDSEDEDNHFPDYINFSDTATGAAGKLLESGYGSADFDAAKELLGLGFDLAVIHDANDNMDRDEADGVLEAIRSYGDKGGFIADKQGDIRSAFALFSLAYQKQLGRVLPEPDGDWHYTDHEKWIRTVNNEGLTYTAFRALWYLSNAPEQEVALEDVDREFVEFTVRLAVLDADDPVYPRNNIDHLQKFSRYVADPELKQHINEQFAEAKARQHEAGRPEQRIAQIAYDHWAADSE